MALLQNLGSTVPIAGWGTLENFSGKKEQSIEAVANPTLLGPYL